MRMNTSRTLQGVLIALAMVFSMGISMAAAPLVWEGESVKNLSGRAFKVMKLSKDPAGKVSGSQVIGIAKVEKGEKIASDEVTYKVKVPANGTYFLWARVRWSTGCGNSFRLTVSGVKGDQILGGDGTYDAMHWISLSSAGRPLAMNLKKGTTTLTLIAKESGAMLDQFLLTTDKKYKPAGIYKATGGLLDLK